MFTDLNTFPNIESSGAFIQSKLNHINNPRYAHCELHESLMLGIISNQFYFSQPINVSIISLSVKYSYNLHLCITAMIKNGRAGYGTEHVHIVWYKAGRLTALHC